MRFIGHKIGASAGS
uniref:Uncharacterized protein n=1 Tax=Rhizophora mucronata TaxID=61149 RepID=A0A2P2P9B4_RHIMU